MHVDGASKEGKAAQAQFPFKCGKAQILFLQHIIDSLAEGGACGMVIDEGVLFHTKTAACGLPELKP